MQFRSEGDLSADDLPGLPQKYSDRDPQYVQPGFERHGHFPGVVGGVAPDAGAPLRSYVQAIIPSATQRLYATADEHTLAMLKKLQALLQKRVADAADPADVPFYRAQLFSVNKLLKPKK